MEDQNHYNFPARGIHKYVAKFIRSLPDLSGKTVLDIPCGDGRATYEFKKKGADVIALDLFPEFIKLTDVEAAYADLSETLPVESNTIDYIVCQEGIEHVHNHLNVLEEFNRVLRKDGVLLLTTPNYSHVRARLSHFLVEASSWKKMPPTEIDGVWFAESKKDKMYFGHLFLLGVHHLQTLLTFTGFKVKQRLRTDLGNTSLIVGLMLYPLFVVSTFISYLSYREKNPHVAQDQKRDILWERVKLNLLPTTLFCKHIFWEIKKTAHLDEVIARLKDMQRQR